MNNLARMHRALIDAMLQSRPHSLDQPVTVAEIYQDLIPYRSVRSTLGFALNADYEHALLQLLSGTEGYAQLEPPEARDALLHELDSPNPNVGMFRNYAACDVIVNIPDDALHAQPDVRYQNGAGHVETPQERELQRTWEAALSDAPPPEDRVNAARDFSGRSAQEAPPVFERTAAERSVKRTQCISCSQPLPAGRNAQFCPYCGYDQTKLVCRSCKEPIEEGWRFCIGCGTPTA